MASSREARNMGWLGVVIGLAILVIDLLLQLADSRLDVDAKPFAVALVIAGGFLATNDR